MSPTAREVAHEVVRRVADEGAYSSRLLPAVLERSGLDERDRALASELAYGTLRRIPELDATLAPLAARPIARMTPGARAALRLGAYQLLHTRIPAHAAVSETVGTVVPRERGFVNAILRRLASGPARAQRDAPGRSPGMAPWMLVELGKLLPPEEVERAARAFSERAPLTLRVNPCRATIEAVEDAFRQIGLEPDRGTVQEECVLLPGGAPSSLPGWKEGWFAVQDQSSAFVVDALAPAQGERVLDVCAAPGGKTGAIACRVGPGGRVVAGDLRPDRAALIPKGLRRLGVRGLVVAQDATRPAVIGPFDRVLVDAPCSGIGAARRRPELLWRPRREELAQLARLQVAIAVAGSDLLAAGGRVVYAVCTFPRAETDAACDALLRHRPDLRPVQTPGPDGPALRHRLWPHRHGTDAMFVAAFQKGG